jgi:hypothetical protein
MLILLLGFGSRSLGDNKIEGHAPGVEQERNMVERRPLVRRLTRQEFLLRGVIASIPVLILFFIAQRYIIEGVSRSGLKG